MSSTQILKLIIKRSLFDPDKQDHKFIFVGSVPHSLYLILEKLASGRRLTDSDETDLNNSIPYYKTKFGRLEGYKVHFVYTTAVTPNTNTSQFELLILDMLRHRGVLTTLADIRAGGIMYSFPRHVTFKQAFDLVEYIFHDNKELTGKDILNTIKRKHIASTNNISGITQDLKPEVAYKAYELATNPEFLKLFKSLARVLGPVRYRRTSAIGPINIANDVYSFEASEFFLGEDDDKVPAGVVKYSFEDLTDFTLVDNHRMSDILNYEQGSTNNTLYYYLAADIHAWLDRPTTQASNNFKVFSALFTKKFKFTDLDDFVMQAMNNRRNFRLSINQDIFSNETENLMSGSKAEAGDVSIAKHLSGALRRTLEKTDCLVVGDIECKNFIFDCFDLGIDTQINLVQLFQDIETNYYLPLVKYVTDGEVQLYNIYKPFFRNLDEKVMALYLKGKDLLAQFYEDIAATHEDPAMRRLKSLIHNDYLVFKWRLDDKNIINIYLFENGYILNEYQNNYFIEQSRVLGYVGLLNKIISKIKNQYKLSELPLANPESILKPTQADIVYSDLVNVAFKIPLTINQRIGWAYYTGVMAPSIAPGVGSKDTIYTTADEFYKASESTGIVFDYLISTGKLMEKLHNMLNTQSNILVTKKYDEEISFLYKDTYGFYDDDNIKHFMRNYLRKKGDRISNAEKDKLFMTVEKIFKITKAHVDTLFTALESMEITSKFDFSYHIDCKLRINKPTHSLVLYIDNVNRYNMSRDLVAQLDTIIRDIMFGTKQVVDYSGILDNYDDLAELFTVKPIAKKPTSPPGAVPESIGRQPAMSKRGKIDMKDLANLDISMLIDIGDIDFADFDMEGDMGTAMDDISGLEIDLNMDAIEKLAQMESELTPADKQSPHVGDVPSPPVEDGYQDIKLKQLVGKAGKTSIANYMKDMRKLYDQELYEPVVKGKESEYSYERSNCPRTPMRQPFIISKEELKTIDPESITGYLKYRGNYYICPRIWDAKVNKPISVRAFIAAGLKSPYSGGLPILNSPNKNIITDKYSVIIRKPTTDTYWSDPVLHKDWPDLLRRTEKEAYPALTYSSKHPRGWCVPCCGSNQPEEFDPTKKKLQQILKPFHYQICKYNGAEEDDEAAPKEARLDGAKVVDEFCKNDEYISNANTSLKNCRLGLLPEELNLLLNNGQELFLNPAETALADGANVFLRRGIVKSNITNIFDSFASILEVKTEKLINLIYNKLTPLEFIGLNNGKLVDVFCTSAEYPVHEEDRAKFTQFIQLYNSLLEYLSIDRQVVTAWLDEANNKDRDTATHVRILYRIYSAFYNYLSYLASPNEIKNYEYVLQLFTRAREWLFKQGVNVLVFDKNISNIRCLDEFNYKTDKLVIFIEEHQDYFVPIFHVTVKYNRVSTSGVIKLDDSLNIASTAATALIKKRPTQQKLIEATKDRLSSIVKLLYIQSGLCSYNLILFGRRLMNSLDIEKILVRHQYTGLGGGVSAEYICLDDKLVIPIYPVFVMSKIHIQDYLAMFAAIKEHRLNASAMIGMFYGSANKYHILLEYNYHIAEFHTEKIKGRVYITQCKFENGLILPLVPEEYFSRNWDKPIAGIAKKFGQKIAIVAGITTNLLKREIGQVSGGGKKAGGSAEDEFVLNVYAMLNLITHQVKNNLSYYLYKSSSKKVTDVTQLVELIYNKQLARDRESVFFECLDRVLRNIIQVADKMGMLEYVKNYFMDKTTGKNRLTDKRFSKKVLNLICRKTRKAVGQGENTSSLTTNSIAGGKQSKGGARQLEALCIRDGLEYKIRLPAEIYEYVLMCVGKDLLNNKAESDSIVKGRYIIPLDDVVATRVVNTIYNDSNEFQQNIIISPEEMSYYLSKNIISKYRRNFAVKEDTRQVIGSLSADTVNSITQYIVGDLKSRIVSGLSDLFSEISSGAGNGKGSDSSTSITTTIFNHDGLFNPQATHGQCIFPYKSAKGGLLYQCGSAQEVLTNERAKQAHLAPSDMICPVTLNKDKTVHDWGYCPEKPDISMTEKGNVGVIKDAYHPETFKKVGNCIFPFLMVDKKAVNPITGAKPLIKISFTCAAQGAVTGGSWCYSNPAIDSPATESPIKLLIGAKGARNAKSTIYKGFWSLDNLYGPEGGLNPRTVEEMYGKLTGLDKAMCDVRVDDDKKEKIERALELDGVVPIPKESYNPDYCILSESKKGYTRKQLYLYGRDVLGIHYKSMLSDSKKILFKNELCAMFNQKIRDMKKAEALAAAGVSAGEPDMENIKKLVYTKDPLHCVDGPTKGGYKLTELREMAITYFGLSQEEALPMSKEALCGHIMTQLNAKPGEDAVLEGLAAQDIDSIYPANRDVELCAKPTGRGGISKKKVNEIATKYFNIDIRGKSKSVLCGMIKKELTALKQRKAAAPSPTPTSTVAISGQTPDTIQVQFGDDLAAQQSVAAATKLQGLAADNVDKIKI
jgi:hypothetical protein